LQGVAAALEVFPRTPSDVREITLGAFGGQFAEGAVRMKFSCRDLAGHTEIEIKIEDDCNTRPSPEDVTLIADVEPAGIDVFTAELGITNAKLQGRAILCFSS